jgi:hypothetical protein
MDILSKMRPYALGASVTILLDRVIDVEMLDTTAVVVILASIVIGGLRFGRRLYA